LIFRRKKRPSLPLSETGEKADAREVVESQSIRGALSAAVVIMVVTIATWMSLADLFDRVFPWFVVPQGALMGVAVRRWGRGFDWRFPVIAAAASVLAAYLGNFFLAADASAAEFDTGLLRIVTSVTAWTYRTFFEEALTAADHIFAICSAMLAAFLSNRQLSRAEVHALRNAHKARGNHE